MNRYPLQFFAYGSAAEPSLPRSLPQSLHLVDSLLSPRGTLPAALRHDDLICCQLVLMLCLALNAAAFAGRCEARATQVFGKRQKLARIAKAVAPA